RFGEQLENRAIRVRFNRVTDQMIERRECRGEPAVVVENRPRAVDVKRRPKLFRDAPKIDIFAMKLAVAITKRMHARKCNGVSVKRRIKTAKTAGAQPIRQARPGGSAAPRAMLR